MCSRWNVIKIVCEIGEFTIRDAILFHKFCIFNKEYFVFLAHRMFGGTFLSVVCVSVCALYEAKYTVNCKRKGRIIGLLLYNCCFQINSVKRSEATLSQFMLQLILC